MQIMLADAQLGSSDDVGLETFKAGAILTEEEQAHAAPAEQWGALGRALAGGAAISHTAQIMREICDAVAHELSKEVRPPLLASCLATATLRLVGRLAWRGVRAATVVDERKVAECRRRSTRRRRRRRAACW